MGWKLLAGSDRSPLFESLGLPPLTTTNHHQGRLIWTPTQETNSSIGGGKSSNSLTMDDLARSQFQPGSSEFLENKDPLKGLQKSVDYLCANQVNGHWFGDYSGPVFLLPGFVIACYVCQLELPETYKKEFISYLRNTQNGDGGSGLYFGAPSGMFGAVMNYVAARILGVDAEDEYAAKARAFISAHGSPLMTSSWAKVWLSLLNVYEWSGNSALLPELWILPEWLPMHPGRLWSYARTVYLPMCYLYGRRTKTPVTPLILSLREELYGKPYESIRFQDHQVTCTNTDRYTPESVLRNWVFWFLGLVQLLIPFWVREFALQQVWNLIQKEDVSTNFLCIGPVNKPLNMVVSFFEGQRDPQNPHFLRHLGRLDDYLWVTERGMHVQGTNGCQVWDAGFAGLALCEAAQVPGIQLNPQVLPAVRNFLADSQVREPALADQYRHPCVGGWPFSTRDINWIVSDCTSLALKSVMALNTQLDQKDHLHSTHIYQAIDLILGYQNSMTNFLPWSYPSKQGPGGWASCEHMRGPSFLEILNPSEVFGDIMVDYPYVELSSEALLCLHAFQTQYWSVYRKHDIEKAVVQGQNFIIRNQHPNGGWYGSWGNCFLYATWFALNALALQASPDREVIGRAVTFILQHQETNGSWSEDMISVTTQEYVSSYQSKGGCPLSTSWALLCLLRVARLDVQWAHLEAIQKGVDFLLSVQLANGDFPNRSYGGNFNKTVMLNYANYRNIFPTMALADFLNFEKQS